MKFHLILLSFLLLWTKTNAQNTVFWDGEYKLQLSDFQSPASQIGDVTVYSLSSAAFIDFSFYMTNGEFMFTKNFNSKVSAVFKRDASALVAPDSIIASDILNYANYTFDLVELYARKFRKRLFEEKGAFSSVSFFKPVYDEIQKEFSERHTTSAKETDMGRNKEKLSVLHSIVLTEMEQYPDFCRSCQPKKRKK